MPKSLKQPCQPSARTPLEPSKIQRRPLTLCPVWNAFIPIFPFLPTRPLILSWHVSYKAFKSMPWRWSRSRQDFCANSNAKDVSSHECFHPKNAPTPSPSAAKNDVSAVTDQSSLPANTEESYATELASSNATRIPSPWLYGVRPPVRYLHV